MMAPKQLQSYWRSNCRINSTSRSRLHAGESAWDVGFEQTEVAWLQSDAGEGQQIATVALYLQDHWEDPNGLSIAPRTHNDADRWFHHGLGRGRPIGINESSEMVTLRSGKGDAIVFDAHLLHRGMHSPWAIPNLLRKLDLPQRTSISLSFGRKNSFSEAFDRGFAMRGRVYSRNSSICRNQYATSARCRCITTSKCTKGAAPTCTPSVCTMRCAPTWQSARCATMQQRGRSAMRKRCGTRRFLRILGADSTVASLSRRPLSSVPKHGCVLRALRNEMHAGRVSSCSCEPRR